MIQLTIYSRPGCHLCEAMTAAVYRAARTAAVPVQIDEIGISTDADLEARYGLEIPVLLVDGRKTAKFRVSEDDVVRMLRDRTLK